ncbi:MAG: methylenetetrahydrofolate reductase, partial [Alloprevotella sp.]|nr:methylenetetrahydrofolate reductase [Alloprevotella sp.]
MKIVDIISGSQGTAFSFEILPPLKGTGMGSLLNTVRRLREYDPKYINITTHRSEYVYTETDNGRFVQRTRIRRRPGTIAVAAA